MSEENRRSIEEQYRLYYVTVSSILSKEVHTNVCPTVNSYVNDSRVKCPSSVRDLTSSNYRLWGWINYLY